MRSDFCSLPLIARTLLSRATGCYVDAARVFDRTTHNARRTRLAKKRRGRGHQLRLLEPNIKNYVSSKTITRNAAVRSSSSGYHPAVAYASSHDIQSRLATLPPL